MTDEFISKIDRYVDYLNSRVASDDEFYFWNKNKIKSINFIIYIMCRIESGDHTWNAFLIMIDTGDIYYNGCDGIKGNINDEKWDITNGDINNTDWKYNYSDRFCDIFTKDGFELVDVTENDMIKTRMYMYYCRNEYISECRIVSMTKEFKDEFESEFKKRWWDKKNVSFEYTCGDSSITVRWTE